MATIQELPDEVLVHIFSYFNILEESFLHAKLTCRRWSAVGAEGKLYENLDLRRCGSLSSAKRGAFGAMLARYGFGVRSARWVQTKHSLLHDVLTHCPRIQSIHAVDLDATSSLLELLQTLADSTKEVGRHLRHLRFSFYINWVEVGRNERTEGYFVQFLEQCAALRALEVDGRREPMGTKRILEAIQVNTSLEEFCKTFCNTGDTQCVIEMLGVQTSLTSLVLEECTASAEVMQRLVERVAKRTNIRELVLTTYVTVVQNGVVAALAACSSLESLRVSMYRRGGTLDALPLAPLLNFNRLTTLQFSNPGVSDEGAEALAVALERNTSLKRLLLADCCIARDGVCALARAVAVHPALTELQLDRNDLRDGDAVAALANAVAANPRLALLSLNRVGISALDVLVDATLSPVDAHLRVLALGEMQLDIAPLARGLKHGRGLIRLDLNQHTKIGSWEAAILAESLLVNTTLLSLSLRPAGALSVIGCLLFTALQGVIPSKSCGLH